MLFSNLNCFSGDFRHYINRIKFRTDSDTEQETATAAARNERCDHYLCLSTSADTALTAELFPSISLAGNSSRSRKANHSRSMEFTVYKRHVWWWNGFIVQVEAIAHSSSHLCIQIYLQLIEFHHRNGHKTIGKPNPDPRTPLLFIYFIFAHLQKAVILISVCSLANAYPGYANDNSFDDGKVPTTHSVDTRPVPVPVYEKVLHDIPSPIPVAKPTYVNVPMWVDSLDFDTAAQN